MAASDMTDTTDTPSPSSSSDEISVTSYFRPSASFLDLYGIYDDDDDIDFYLHSRSIRPNVRCPVCDDKVTVRHQRPCCDGVICDDCLEQYVTVKVQDGIVAVRCPCAECNEPMGRKEVRRALPADLTEKYERFLIELDGNPNIRACPRCSFLYKRDNAQKGSTKVVCPSCDLQWCFSCHSPWHDGVTCRKYRKGNKEFKSWVRKKGRKGDANARRCPKCRVYIQRSSGCDHMTCSKCHCDFCYQCGCRMLSMGWLGNHFSRYSVLGCKYNYYPDKPVRRKLARGAIFSGGAIVSPLVAGVLAGVVLAASPILLSVYGAFRLRRKYKQTH